MTCYELYAGTDAVCKRLGDQLKLQYWIDEKGTRQEYKSKDDWNNPDRIERFGGHVRTKSGFYRKAFTIVSEKETPLYAKPVQK